jgi:hypothetical protein
MVERWLLVRLRHPTFHSLAEVNAAIAELLTRAQRGTTNPAARRDLPQAIGGDRPASAQGLPASLTSSSSGGFD